MLVGVTIESPPEVVDLPSNIGNRVLQNYSPLLGMAQLLSDENFIQDILSKRSLEQTELEHAQQTELLPPSYPSREDFFKKADVVFKRVKLARRLGAWG
jgi:hypothetical protein